MRYSQLFTCIVVFFGREKQGTSLFTEKKFSEYGPETNGLFYQLYFEMSQWEFTYVYNNVNNACLNAT